MIGTAWAGVAVGRGRDAAGLAPPGGADRDVPGSREGAGLPGAPLMENPGGMPVVGYPGGIAPGGKPAPAPRTAGEPGARDLVLTDGGWGGGAGDGGTGFSAVAAAAGGASCLGSDARVVLTAAHTIAPITAKANATLDIAGLLMKCGWILCTLLIGRPPAHAA
jgi:hypothetical protein